MQFWSEIIFAISNPTRAARSFDFEITRMISDQIALHSVQLHYVFITVHMHFHVIWICFVYHDLTVTHIYICKNLLDRAWANRFLYHWLLKWRFLPYGSVLHASFNCLEAHKPIQISFHQVEKLSDMTRDSHSLDCVVQQNDM